MKSYKDWAHLDIESIEPVEVSAFEKEKVKRHVLKKRPLKKSALWRNVAIAAVLTVGGTAAMSFAVPSIASQIPFMKNVISYFQEENRYTHFAEFSTELGLVQTSNGVTVMIENAVYDGTSLTVAFAIETDKNYGEQIHFSGGSWFDVKGAIGMSGSSTIEQISDTHYVGIETITSSFKKGEESPETIHVTWNPEALGNLTSDTLVEGDWSFEFALTRINGETKLVNEPTVKDGITFILQSIEQTDVSTVIQYEQTIEQAVAEKWPSVTPMFVITDDLGNVYVDHEGGGGVAYDNGITFTGTTTFDTIHENATELIIQPIAILSSLSGTGSEELPMDPIVVDLK